MPFKGFKPLLALIAIGIGVSFACTFLDSEPAPTPIPPTFTPDFTATVLASASLTPTPTLPPTLTPTVTITPSPTPTIPLPPTSTPHPIIGFQYDDYTTYPLDPDLSAMFGQNWLSFTLTQDIPPEDTTATPEQTVYVVNPATRETLPVINLPASTEDRIYWSPTGRHLVYFLRPNASTLQPLGGLYLFNLESGVSVRLYALESLQPRGIAGHVPIWSPDGTQLAMVLPTAYATDIFIVNTDGSDFRNLTNHPSYDFFPAWSPDGTQIAFVSDRVFCPTWNPQQPNTCDFPNAAPPTSGNLYLYNVATRTTLKVNDTVLNSPPQWLNNRYISVTSGNLDPFSSASNLWLYDVVAGSAWPVTPNDGAVYTDAAWRQDAAQVVYQRIAEPSVLILADRLGAVQQTLNEYTFPRFGLVVDWSPDGNYIAIGGRNGQCPYGLIVLDNTFQLTTTPAANIFACDPMYSPDGQFVAFVGTRTSLINDGNTDLYLSAANGLAIRPLTGTLDGRVQLLGWIGNNSP